MTSPELKEDPRPIQADCGCYTCSTGFSRGYLRHLFAAHELLAYTLCSLHNLYFIQHLMRQIREAIRADRLADLRDEVLSRYEGSSAGLLAVPPQDDTREPPPEAKARLDHRGRVENAIQVSLGQ